MFIPKQWILIIIYMICVSCFGVFIHFLQYSDVWFCYNCNKLDKNETLFDYIVVGCGSAGAIIARRLSENKKLKILVLEAGRYGNTLLDIPSLGLLLHHSQFDWQYQTIPQTNSCLGLHNNVSLWPMGKIMGGTGMLNNMVYVRGHSEDFNFWYKDKKGYSFNKDVLPYFKKLEQWSDEDKSVGSTYISNLTFSSILPKYILNAAKELGYLITEKTENCEEGFGMPKMNLKNGKRWTPAHSLLEKENQNIFLRTSRIVEKLLMHDNLEVYGVKYRYRDKYYIAKATKGVILSAGVIGTTKILLHSGIGPEQHLKDVNIEAKVDLPVGKNLQDHVTTGFDLLLFNQSLGIGIQQILSPFSLIDYFWTGSGPWTTGGCDVLAYFKTIESENVPDLQFMVMPLGINEDRGIYLRRMLGISDDSWNNYFSQLNNTVTATILPVVLHPKSRGYVQLVDNQFSSPVVIDPKYLTHQYDIDVLVKGIEIIRRLADTKEMKKLGTSFNTNIYPPCGDFDFGTKPYWNCYIKHLTITSYHPVGTCKMGSTDDETSVVDFDFAVKGVDNLFVVDGSVFPTLTSGNINGAIFVLAEMASDALKYREFLNESKCVVWEIFIKSFTCTFY